MKRRATKAEVSARVDDLLRVRLLGAEARDLCDFVRQQETEKGSCWELKAGETPLSDSQILRYAAKTDVLLAAQMEKDRGKLFARHVAQRRMLLARAMESGDLRTALAVLKDECELLELYRVQTAEDLERRLTVLEERRTKREES